MKKTVFQRAISLILAVFMVVSAFVMVPFTAAAVEADVAIGTPAELLAFKQQIVDGNDFAGKVIQLTADIDMSGVDNWPLEANAFKGTFDGNGHTIQNLNATNTDINAAGLLFGLLYGATVKNLSMVGGTYTSSRMCTSIIAGATQPSDTVTVLENLYINYTIEQTAGNDGSILLARAEGSTEIKNCVVDGTINYAGGAMLAGVVARPKGSSVTLSITDCAFLGTINCNNSGAHTGVFWGYNENADVTLTNCANLGTVNYNEGGVNADETPFVDTITSENFEVMLASKYAAWTKTGAVEMMPASVAAMLDKTYIPSVKADVTIGTPEELVAFVQAIVGGNRFEGQVVQLTADLDMTGVAWTCPGYEKIFSGTFDGCGHSISNLTGVATANAQGLLFGGLEGATVQNLCMLGGSFTGKLAGGVIASIASGNKVSVLKNIYVDTAVEGTLQDNAGLLGRAIADVVIEGCVVASAINGLSTSSWGGFAGFIGRAKVDPIALNVVISNCAFMGTIVSKHAKGIVAPILGLRESGDVEIKNCFDMGTITVEQGLYGIDDTIVDTINPDTFDFAGYTALMPGWVQTGEKEMMPAGVAQMLGKSYTPDASTPSYVTPGNPIYSYACKEALDDVSSSRVLLDAYVNGAVDSWDLEKSRELVSENDVSIKNELPVPQTHVTFEFNVESAGTYNIAIEYRVTNEEMFQYVMQFAIDEFGKDTFYLQYADGYAWVVVTQALEAGKHSFTVYAPDNCFKTLEGGKMILSCNVRNFKVYQNISAGGLTVLNGAAIRMDAEASELRYTVRIDKEIYDSLVSTYGAKNVTIGVVFGSASDAAKLGTLTKEAFNAEAYTYYDYNKPQLLEDEEGAYFYGCWKPDSVDGYDDMMSAAGYIRYKAEDGKSKYIYTVYNSENDRSIALVATRAVADVKSAAESGYENAVTVNGTTMYSPYTANEYANLVALAAYYQGE